MAIMGHRMREPLMFKRYTGSTKTGSPIYKDAPVTVYGRLQFQRSLVVGRDGEQVVSEAVLYLTGPVGLHDLFLYQDKEWPIISVAEKKRLNGTIDHWEVRL